MANVVERPYEFLVRWRDGKISGAHVGFETAIIEDGKPDKVIPQDVQPVAVGEQKGFPLKDILDQLYIDALKDRDAALDQATAEKAFSEMTVKSTSEAVAQADAKVTEMLAAVDSALTQLNTQVESLNAVKAKFAPEKEE